MDYISRVALFLEVVRHQSFAAAARHIGVTGPALSKQVQALEDQLGVRLLHRTTRQVTLTEEGAIYSDGARKALEDLREAELQIQERKLHPSGLLKINAPMSFGIKYLSRPIAAFAHHYPDVTLKVDFDDRQVDIISEGYDIVVRIGALQDSSLIVKHLAECPLLLCASPATLEKFGTPTEPEALSSFPAISYNTHGNIDEWRYQDHKGIIGSVQLQRVFSANNAEMMLEACLQGVGITLLPIFMVATYVQTGQLVRLLPAYNTYPERSIYALYPQNRHLSAKVRVFLDWLHQCSKNYPW